MYAQAPIACDLSIHIIVQVRQDQHTPDRATGVEATESAITITDRNRHTPQGRPLLVSARRRPWYIGTSQGPTRRNHEV